jgi:hypothetical protein
LIDEITEDSMYFSIYLQDIFIGTQKWSLNKKLKSLKSPMKHYNLSSRIKTNETNNSEVLSEYIPETNINEETTPYIEISKFDISKFEINFEEKGAKYPLVLSLPSSNFVEYYLWSKNKYIINKAFDMDETLQLNEDDIEIPKIQPKIVNKKQLISLHLGDITILVNDENINLFGKLFEEILDSYHYNLTPYTKMMTHYKSNLTKHTEEEPKITQKEIIEE